MNNVLNEKSDETIIEEPSQGTTPMLRHRQESKEMASRNLMAIQSSPNLNESKSMNGQSTTTVKYSQKGTNLQTIKPYLNQKHSFSMSRHKQFEQILQEWKHNQSQ